MDRVATDAVLELFKETKLHCDMCDVSFPKSEVDLHFNSSHEFRERCIYCHGPIYMYRVVDLPKAYLFHKCPDESMTPLQ